MVAVLGDGLVVGDVLRQLVVQLRKLRLLDALDGDLEGGLLAGQLRNIVLGEGDDDVALVAGLHADDLLLKAGHKRVRAKLDVIVLSRAAVELLTVDEAGKIDRGVVAQLRLALNVDQTGVALLVERLMILGDFKALVLAENDLGIDGDLKGVDELLVVVDLLIEQAGRADALKAALGTAGLKSLLRQRLDGFGIEHVLAVHALDDGARRLALAEAGHIELALVLFIYFVDRVIKHVGRDLHLKGRHILFFLFDVLDVHWISSSNHLSPGILCT